jgi:CRP-like cAMP-binding protein
LQLREEQLILNLATKPTVKQRVCRFPYGEKLRLPLEEFWLITEGIVKSYTFNEDGEIITLGYWSKDDVIGQALSAIQPYFCECMTNVELLIISADELDKFPVGILHHCQRLQQLTYLVRKQPIEERFLCTLKWLAVRFGYSVEKGNLIDLRLTHQELAELIGVTRVTITKLINKLEREGVIFRSENRCIGLTKKAIANI